MTALANPGPIDSRVRVAIRGGDIVKVRNCSECGREGVCLDGDESAFYVHSRTKAGDPIWRRQCKSCYTLAIISRDDQHGEHVNAQRRARYAELKKDPEFMERKRKATREAQRRRWADPAKREVMKARHREWTRKQRADPAKREALAEAHRKWRASLTPEERRDRSRMYYVLGQMRKGKTVRHYSTPIDGTLPTVPSEPFRRWLVEYDRLGGFDGNSEALAAALGIGIRRVGAIMRGEYKNVAVDVVSRALTDAYLTPSLDGRVIVTFDDLYPDEEEI